MLGKSCYRGHWQIHCNTMARTTIFIDLSYICTTEAATKSQLIIYHHQKHKQRDMENLPWAWRLRWPETNAAAMR
ncbi:bifunctional epoxide hydrolase 2-like [Dorcoceras hygrometricum]|uniref:Bifunctional epoxide hydrolase 2-like n=1 Tax=Dorcoceras hygrometricum TaxID=472368 RepID=A0A2Z7A313_9LAMI|nr:bifunctional epoxide hydrolase 2-like [Dorcoceras hygrometricum]